MLMGPTAPGRSHQPEACCRRFSGHARTPWEARLPPGPTDRVRRPARAAPRSRSRRGMPATRPATPDNGPAASGASALRRATAGSRPPVHGPAVPKPGLASLPTRPITRLPLRVRQCHDYSSPLRNGPVTGGLPGRPRRRAVGGLGATADREHGRGGQAPVAIPGGTRSVRSGFCLGVGVEAGVGMLMSSPSCGPSGRGASVASSAPSARCGGRRGAGGRRWRRPGWRRR